MTAEGIGIGLTGLGVDLPAQVRTNDFWPAEWVAAHEARMKLDLTTSVDHAVRQQLAEVDPEVIQASVRWRDDVFRGTRERRVLEDEREPSDMEAAAAQRAMAAAGVEAKDIDCLLLHSGLQDFAAPANYPVVASKLGLSQRMLAMNSGAGCASFLAQMGVAAHLIKAGAIRRALIVVSCAISRVSDYRLPSSVNGGDGAVAGVIERIEPGHGYVASSQRIRGDLHGGIRLVPAEHPEERWYWTDRYAERLSVQNTDPKASRMMGARAASFCREVCQEVVDEAGYSMEDVDFLCMSNATAWFPEICCAALGIDQAKRLKVEDHFQRFGHLLAGSAPLNLYLAHSLGKIKPGDLVLIYSPGVGFVQLAQLYRWNLPAGDPAAFRAGGLRTGGAG
jgi:3-oxoacyl-[acyl-carrier-protein] synthase-3